MFLCHDIFSFVIIARFIPAPEMTTTEGKINVNGILNCSTNLLLTEVVAAALGPYKNDQGSIFPSTARAS